MKAGDIVVDAQLVHQNGEYTIIFTVLDLGAKEISITKWHGNQDLKKLDIEAVKGAKISVFGQLWTGEVIFCFVSAQDSDKIYKWRMANVSGDIKVTDTE